MCLLCRELLPKLSWPFSRYTETFYIKTDRKPYHLIFLKTFDFFFYIHISLINHTPGFHQPFLGESCLFQFCWFLRCLSQSQIDPEYLHHHYSKEKHLLKQMCCQVNELKILYYRYHPISSYRPRWSSQSNIDHSNTTVHSVRLHLTGDSSESHTALELSREVIHVQSRKLHFT